MSKHDSKYSFKKVTDWIIESLYKGAIVVLILAVIIIVTMLFEGSSFKSGQQQRGIIVILISLSIIFAKKIMQRN